VVWLSAPPLRSASLPDKPRLFFLRFWRAHSHFSFLPLPSPLSRLCYGRCFVVAGARLAGFWQGQVPPVCLRLSALGAGSPEARFSGNRSTKGKGLPDRPDPDDRRTGCSCCVTR
jgi:hypothetical protein